MKFKPLTIILADDEANLRMSLRTVFRQAKYSVKAFDNGADALSFIQEANPDEKLALVSDILMPRMSGLDLIRETRNLMPDIPIIAMTGYGDKPMITELLRSGCDDFLDKPFEPEVIIAALKRIVERRQLYINHQRVRLKAIESMEREFGLELGVFRAAQAKENNTFNFDTGPDHQPPFDVTSSDGWLIIQPKGNLTMDATHTLKEELEKRLAEGERQFRFEMQAVRDMDALALSVFCALSQELRDFGTGCIQLVEVPAPVQHMFRYLRLDNEFCLSV